MGRRKQQRQDAAAASFSDDVDVARNLRGMPWLVWLLFETPSGFAMFSFNSYIFEEENAIEHIWANFVEDYMAKNCLWLKQFQKFEDKSAAINCTTGLGKELRDMLKIWCRRGEKLMVGSLEYKEIIEADQELKGVTCLYNDFVTEVMWGIKNLMHILVPEEQKVLTKEERLPVSKGLEMILHRYKFDVKPEMINNDIVETACYLYHCDFLEKRHSKGLHLSDYHLLKISGLNSSEWDTMKLVTALNKITRPGEEIEHPPEMFSSDELLKIEKDADKYKDKIYKTAVSEIWNDLVCSYSIKKEKLRHMQFLVEAAAQEAAKREVNQAGND
ncbi:uncharacterized protein LOC127782266 isoform X2 [Oryza glaberrima]|uniref:uncharacterized protein LOC127782266 isoform X2 n=1 Tax=Oryza glaberrima TaxID=4538 RepID=UPI00224C47A3|nr:uncharacterized protein LOC127782266 isoform X2 [Oryza glaberrima]